jgi:amino acid permease
MILLVLVAFMVRQSVVMLITCGVQNQKFNYEELTEHLLGQRGYYAAVISMFLFAYGGQLAYLIIVGDTIPLVLKLIFSSSLPASSIMFNRQFIICFFGLFVILPLCLLRDMGKLAWSSFISIFADVILIIMIFIASFRATKEQSEHFQLSDWDDVSISLFSGIGTMSFAFVCQHNSFLVFQTLKTPTITTWKKVANLSVAFSYFLCLILGLTGFFAFFPFLKGDLLNNFPTGYITIAIARALLGGSMLLTYPMESFVARHCSLTLYHRWKKDVSFTSQPSRTNHEKNVVKSINFDGIISPPRINGSLLQEEDEEEIVIENFNPIQQNEKTNSSAAAGRKKPKASSRYFLVNQEFFSDEAEQRQSNQEGKGNGEEEVINFSDAPPASSDAGKAMINEFSRTESTIATLILWGSTLVVSLLVEKLGIVSALTGVVAASTIGYTLPGLIYIRTFYEEYYKLLYEIFNVGSSAIIASEHSLPFYGASPGFDEQLDESPRRSSAENEIEGRRTIMSRLYDTVVLINVTSLKKLLENFGIPMFMVFFGICTLTIGISTVLFDQFS